MAINYKNCEPEVPVSHFCDSCAPPELGNVRSVMLIKQGTSITIPFEPSEITAAIQTGDIIVIPFTKGTFDGGTPKMGAGYGDVKEKVLGFDFVLAAKDPNYKENIDFWSYAEKETWNLGFRTETLLHIVTDNVKVIATAPIEEDVESEVVWNIEAKWFGKDKPKASAFAPVKSIFNCYEVTT